MIDLLILGLCHVKICAVDLYQAICTTFIYIRDRGKIISPTNFVTAGGIEKKM